MIANSNFFKFFIADLHNRQFKDTDSILEILSTTDTVFITIIDSILEILCILSNLLNQANISFQSALVYDNQGKLVGYQIAIDKSDFERLEAKYQHV